MKKSIVPSQLFWRTVGNLSQPLVTKRQVENRDSKSGLEATFLLLEEVELLINGVLFLSEWQNG